MPPPRFDAPLMEVTCFNFEGLRHFFPPRVGALFSKVIENAVVKGFGIRKVGPPLIGAPRMEVNPHPLQGYLTHKKTPTLLGPP